jgi:hypothetical protein
MGNARASLLAASCIVFLAPVLQIKMQAQEARPATLPKAMTTAAAPVYKLDDAYLEWPLPEKDRAYGAIDGKHLHEYVVQQAEISDRYRDQGHPQFWGRITGTSSDTEDAQWLVDKLKKIGLSDVHAEPIDLKPQWIPQSWDIVATGNGKSLRLDGSAQPAYQTPATPPEGLDLEAVYAGTGSEADFAGRDVRGKAVFMFAMPLPGSMQSTLVAEGGFKRAATKGAAAIFDIMALPGNMRNQLYPTHVDIPVFALGMEDGYTVRDLIGESPAGQAPHVKIKLDVALVPNLKTSTVWATLPGATDETIYVVAHRDGWFESATDNGSGVATMIGLAEYYAKIPKAKRRRTIIFLGLSGHHNGGSGGSNPLLIARKGELFAKTALFINSEHTSTVQTYFYGEDIRRSDMSTAMLWYAGGPSRPKLQEIAIQAFREFGVPTYADPEVKAPPSDLGSFYRFVPSVEANDFNMYFHTTGETPDTVPWTGLESTTRAYAKIIDEVNKLELSDLQRPEEPAPPPPAP